MICYLDQTFCDSDCTNSKCFRYLSEQGAQRAAQLNLPVAWSDFSDTCSYYTPKGE